MHTQNASFLCKMQSAVLFTFLLFCVKMYLYDLQLHSFYTLKLLRQYLKKIALKMHRKAVKRSLCGVALRKGRT